MKKRHVATFKLFGKKYGVRRGGNLHALAILFGMLSATALGYILICLFVGYANTL